MDFWETAALKWPELMVITLWQVLVDVESCFVSLKAWGKETEDLLKVIFFICDVSDVCVRVRMCGAYSYTQRPEERGSRSFETGGCELLSVAAGSWTLVF